MIDYVFDTTTLRNAYESNDWTPYTPKESPSSARVKKRRIPEIDHYATAAAGSPASATSSDAKDLLANRTSSTARTGAGSMPTVPEDSPWCWQEQDAGCSNPAAAVAPHITAASGLGGGRRMDGGDKDRDGGCADDGYDRDCGRYEREQCEGIEGGRGRAGGDDLFSPFSQEFSATATESIGGAETGETFALNGNGDGYNGINDGSDERCRTSGKREGGRGDLSNGEVSEEEEGEEIKSSSDDQDADPEPFGFTQLEKAEGCDDGQPEEGDRLASTQLEQSEDEEQPEEEEEEDPAVATQIEDEEDEEHSEEESPAVGTQLEQDEKEDRDKVAKATPAGEGRERSEGEDDDEEETRGAARNMRSAYMSEEDGEVGDVGDGDGDWDGQGGWGANEERLEDQRIGTDSKETDEKVEGEKEGGGDEGRGRRVGQSALLSSPKKRVPRRNSARLASGRGAGAPQKKLPAMKYVWEFMQTMKGWAYVSGKCFLVRGQGLEGEESIESSEVCVCIFGHALLPN